MTYISALGGLLHDIGKFWQLGTDQVAHPDFAQYGTQGNHATFSAAFVRDFASFNQPELINAIHKHHQPDSDLAERIALADQLANAFNTTHRKQPQYLRSIFTQIGDQQIKDWYIPLQPLGDLRQIDLFPTPNPTGHNTYSELWDMFVAEAKQLRHINDLPAYLENIQSLLQRFTWCIPSGQADISLYDHSRVTGALAACLSRQALNTIKQSDETVVAQLVEGDISGIQQFIYTLKARGAARQLRARSLYLQIFTEAVARFILTLADLPITNLIYAGGGRFYLLLPPDSDALIQQARQRLDEILLKHHDGGLYLALGTTDLRVIDFSGERFKEKWRDVGQATNRDKRQRFAHYEPGFQIEKVFSARPSTGELGKRYAERDEDDPNTDITSDFVKSLQDFGREIPKARYLVLAQTTPQSSKPGTLHDVLLEMGVMIDLLDAEYKPRLNTIHQPRRVAILGMSDQPNFEKASSLYNVPTTIGLRYTANVTPLDADGNTLEFNSLVEKSQGIRRLGVLRMDVDDLGQLFSQGFQNNATLARVASLSSALNLYFEGWVGELCRQFNQNAENQQMVYTVYSGGDDLFIVGTWHVIPHLAHQIQADFKRFACDNPAVHISAGITLHSGKYPLYQAANDAEHALDMAKRLAGKNAFSFLGKSLYWSQWDQLKEASEILQNLVDQPNVGHNLLQVILQLHADYEIARNNARVTRSKTEQIVWGPWVWRSAYRFHQIAKRAEDQKNEIEEIYQKIESNDFRGLEVVGIAARWAHALIR